MITLMGFSMSSKHMPNIGFMMSPKAKLYDLVQINYTYKSLFDNLGLFLPSMPSIYETEKSHKTFIKNGI